MAYATVAQLRDYLNADQATSANIPEQKLQSVLDRASSLLDTLLGFSFSGYDDEATERIVARGSLYDPATSFFVIPAHEAGSVTSVKPRNESVEITDFTETDTGALFREGKWERPYYDVTAKWGHGEPPPVVEQLCLELAVHMYQTKGKAAGSEIYDVGANFPMLVKKGAISDTQAAAIRALQATYMRESKL